MGKHKPKLYIGTNELEDPQMKQRVELEVDRVSITPRTFMSRTFQDSGDGEVSYWYEDLYQSLKGSQVIRFGIDRGNISVDRTGQDSGKMLGEDIKIFSASGNQSTGGASSASQYKAGVQHHLLEVFLIQKAIRHLLASKDNNTVLVHIFERDGDAIKFESDSRPKTHTVLLYKNPAKAGDVKQQILVIDPNNFTYSSHLKELNNNSALLEFKDLVEIVTLHSKKLQIYKPAGNIGPNPNEYRDCADIGVKLAFLLNEARPGIKVIPDVVGFKIDEDSLKGLGVIKMVSNAPGIDDGFLDKSGPVRIKQASDVGVIKKFYKAEGFIKQLLEMVSGHSEDMHINKKKELVSVLNDIKLNDDGDPDYVGLFSLLNVFDEKTCESLQKLINQHRLELSGLCGDEGDVL